MEKIDIHQKIYDKLDFFIESKKIPHIVFYGPSGSGKHTILYNFIQKIYKNVSIKIKEHVMWVNCAHCKGIRFIRDELKFFAKTNIQNQNGILFKSIILFNACKLTTDAQSALRRCIEQFSHTTRFFIIVENINQLLKPILSRFCNIYIPNPVYKTQNINLYKYFIKDDIRDKNFNKKKKWLKNNILKKNNYNDQIKCLEFSNKLYQKGYSALDLIDFFNNNNTAKFIDEINKYEFIIFFDKIRKEFRNEKILISMILYFMFMRKKLKKENILTM
jgi:DNA polymerase III delta prime subunit